jgi:hypothetical protein
MTRVALLVFEQNGPCSTVGARLAKLHARPELTFEFVKAASERRGVVGTVHMAGLVLMHDEVLIYPPV